MTGNNPKSPIGGGPKKVLYTLNTVRRIGLKNSAKALGAKNTCKACGLGMGGQLGGMTNELGEFPSVCNKSIQAQSSDIQPAIPAEIFLHSLEELRELSAHQLEHLGRLGKPVYKAAHSKHYREVEWDWAIQYAADKFCHTSPARSFFYSSGRSSSEAGFVLQLLARLYGTNNVNNCSYYCHQASNVGLGTTIGTGTATVELEDLSACDLVFVMGANPASNHPRFIHKLKACRDRGGEVIVINPAKEPGLIRFAVPKSARSMITGGTWIASDYLQPRIGTDIALFKGLAKALLESNHHDQDFINRHTLGFENFAADIEATDWQTIVDCCGVAKSAIQRVASSYAKSQRTVFAWGMGMTHHRNGVENVEYIANLALLRGMVGKRYAGLLPLRGHSNVQGIGTMGVKPVLDKAIFRRMEQAFGVSLPDTDGYDTLAGLEAASRGEIDAALIMGGNLYGATPDAQWAEQALDTIGFKLFLTTTLNQGHVHGVGRSESLILPVTARDEEWQPTTQESMFNFVRLSDGGIKRLDHVRPETAILCDLAAKLLPGSAIDFTAFRQHGTIREAIAKTVPGMEQLADIDAARQEFHVHGRVLHSPTFKTPSQKAHFCTRPLPLAKTSAEYPVTLMREGDRATLTSPQGSMEGVTLCAFDLPRGNAMAYFPEANVLIGRESDPRSKTPAFKSVPIAVHPFGSPG